MSQAEGVSYRFLEAAGKLRRLRERIGYTGQARRIRLLAYLYQQEAWFLVHCGRSLSAFEQASRAIRLSTIAHHDSADPFDLQRLGEAALIASHACLLRSEPRWALKILKLAAQAAEARRVPVGSDYHRQQGVASFQLWEPEEARHSFGESIAWIEKLSEAKTRFDLLMTGTRQINLIAPINWDGALEILGMAENAFGIRSLEYSMNIHWTAACGLATDSRTAHHRALEIVKKNTPTAQRFGHQATIATLLSVTPDLRLSNADRYEWVRHALYENAFRNR